MRQSSSFARRCAKPVLLALVLTLLIGTPIASLGLVAALVLNDVVGFSDVMGHMTPRLLVDWWRIAYLYGGNPGIQPLVLWSGALAFGVTALNVGARLMPRRGRSLQLQPARQGSAPIAPKRARSAAFGSSDWMPERDMLQYAPEPHPVHGGVVFGAAVRLDLDPDADAGSAPLLRDHCTEDATHGQVFYGSGGGKTSAQVAPNMHPEHGWRGNIFLNDPSSQAAPMFAGWREELEQRVVCLGPHRDPGDDGLPRVGIDLFHGIDPTKRKFERQVRWVVNALGQEYDEKVRAGENGMFKEQARALQECILADMLSDPETSREERTPAGLLQRLMTDDNDLRGKLEDIANGSRCLMARRIAHSLKKSHPRTWGSFRNEVNTDLKWLLDPECAAIVSDTSPQALKPGDFADTDVTIFLQLGIDMMEDTPQVGRAIINAMLAPIYQKDRRTARRYLLLLDERKLFGNPRTLALLGSQGRKYGITCVSMWHSLSQMDDVLGKSAKEWRNNSSWEAYAGLKGEDAKVISERLDTYTALVESEGRSRSTGGGAGGSNRSVGTNTGTTLQATKLATPGQLEFQFSKSEQIVFRRGAKAPIRCAKAFHWQRPDMAATVGEDPYAEKEAA